MMTEQDGLGDYDMIEGEGDEWMWGHELKEILKNADTIHVNEEDFEEASEMVDAELDDDGFIMSDGEYVLPHVPTEVDDTVEFVPVHVVAHEDNGALESLEERMERYESTPEKLHVSDLYGVDMYAGELVFLFNDFYLGLGMDVSEWEPMVTVKSLYEYKCDLCGHEYTNRDFEVPEDATFYWTHSCPECDKPVDRTPEMHKRLEEMKEDSDK